jgi:hypothetical protein
MSSVIASLSIGKQGQHMELLMKSDHHLQFHVNTPVFDLFAKDNQKAYWYYERE